MFLQLESILADRIVLKGGAAVQFYLPINYQRTSVYIDTLFYGSKDVIASLHYFVDVPSVCSGDE